jgi:glycosyltransferase involved in cell wall biosynthesis
VHFHDEGLGLPLLEVQYAGLPVVAPDAPVFREALGSSGWFIDPSDADAAAQLILARLGETESRAAAARAAEANLIRWNAAAATDFVRVASILAGTASPASGAEPQTCG